MNTMRVVTQHRFGGPDVLEVEVRPVPEPGPTQVRVRARAAGVNPVDWKTRAGGGIAGLLGDPPFVLGWDVAGVVDAVGFGVTRFAIGDAVYGMPHFPAVGGGYAEYVVAPSRHFAAAPSTLSVEQAAALPLAGLTAWQALVDTADVRPGQRVLVHAAAGGVGHLAVQIAKARGATVIGTATAAKHDQLAALGVDRTIDYRNAAFEDEVRDVDVVLDLVGGEYALRSLRTLRPGGLLITVPGGVDEAVAVAAAGRGVRATGILVEPDHAGLGALADAVDRRVLRVLVERSYPLADAAKAHIDGEAGRTFGKLVLAM